MDLNILRTDLPVLAVMLSCTVAEVKGLSSKEERETLVETLNRLTVHSEKQEWRLQPCLSQPEARVVSAVLEEAEQAGERVSEAIGRIPELSFPQQICALLASGQEVTQSFENMGFGALFKRYIEGLTKYPQTEFAQK